MSVQTLPRIDATRLAQIETLSVDPGDHPDFETGHCAMEIVSWLLDLDHTDDPECIHPSLSSFVRGLNDLLDDAGRQRLRPYAVRIARHGAREDVHEIIEAANDALDLRWRRLSGRTLDEVIGERAVTTLDSLANVVAHSRGDERATAFADLAIFESANQEAYVLYGIMARSLPDLYNSIHRVRRAGGRPPTDDSIADELAALIASHPAFEGYRRTRAEAVDAAFALLDDLIAD